MSESDLTTPMDILYSVNRDEFVNKTNIEFELISPMNVTQGILETLGVYQPPYGKLSSILLVSMYVPVLLVSLVGNVTACVVLIHVALHSHHMKTAFIINLVIADLSGK